MQTGAKRMYSQFAECSLRLCKDKRLFIYFMLIDLHQHKNFVQSIANKVIRS